MTQFAVVAPPPLQPPRVGLVTSARDALAAGDETEGRWEGGFAFRPETNVDPTIRDVCGDGSGDDVPGSQPPHDSVETVPWMVEVEDDCTSTFGYRGIDYIGQVTRALAAATPKGVEREFWSGAVAQAAGWPNLFLASAGAADVTPVAGTAVDLPEAFELLEDALATCGNGGRGMIHVAAWSTPSYALIRREGALLLTARDTIVVSGSGYLGTGPDGADPSAAGKTWLYATGLVDVRLGPIQVFGQVGNNPRGVGSYQDPAASGFDVERFAPALVNRATNDLVVKARRMVAASWDGACHFAVLANLNPGDV